MLKRGITSRTPEESIRGLISPISCLRNWNKEQTADRHQETAEWRNWCWSHYQVRPFPHLLWPTICSAQVYVCPAPRSTKDLPCSTAEWPREGSGPPKAFAISDVPEWCGLERTSAGHALPSSITAPNSMNQYPGNFCSLYDHNKELKFSLFFNGLRWSGHRTAFYPLGRIRACVQQLTANINSPGQPWFRSIEHRRIYLKCCFDQDCPQLKSILHWRLMAQTFTPGLHKEKLQSSVFDSSPYKTLAKERQSWLPRPGTVPGWLTNGWSLLWCSILLWGVPLAPDSPSTLSQPQQLEASMVKNQRQFNEQLATPLTNYPHLLLHNYGSLVLPFTLSSGCYSLAKEWLFPHKFYILTLAWDEEYWLPLLQTYLLNEEKFGIS